MFYGDLYPNQEGYNEHIAKYLKVLVEARKNYAYGDQQDYFSEKNCIGFVRRGDRSRPGCAVLLSNKAGSVGFFCLPLMKGKSIDPPLVLVS